jgi:hypothetical protein
MRNINWAQEFRDGAVFLDELAAMVDDPRARRIFKWRAWKRRVNALLVDLGVPGRLLLGRPISPPVYDQVVLDALMPVLRAHLSGDLTEREARDLLMQNFDMPMPKRDFVRLQEYVDSELRGLRDCPDEIQLTANGIASFIENEQHDYAYRVACGWPDKPCPWGGDEPDSKTAGCVVSFE